MIWSRREMLQDTLAFPVTRLVLAFCFCVVVSILFAIDRAVALDFGLRLVSLLLLFFLTVLLVQDTRRLRMTLICLVLSMVVAAIVLLAETGLGTTLVATTKHATTAMTAEGFHRSSGASQYDPTTAAIMLSSGVVLALTLAIETRRNRGLFLAAAIIGSLALILSFSRSAALVYALTLMLLAARHRKSRLVLPALLIGAFLTAAFLPFVPDSYFERFASLLSGGDGDWTIDRRWTYQVIGIDILTERPLFGVGPGNYRDVFTDPSYRFLPGRTLLGRVLHNMYLSVATEYGLLGFGVFLALILAAFFAVFSVMRRPAAEELGGLAAAVFFSMLAFFVASVFNPNEYNKYTWIFLALACATTIINRRLHAQAAASRNEGVRT